MNRLNELIEKVFEIPTVSFLWFVLTLYSIFLTDKHKEFLKRLNWIVFGYLLYVFTSRKIEENGKVTDHKYILKDKSLVAPGTFVVFWTGLRGIRKQYHLSVPKTFGYVRIHHTYIRLFNNKKIFLKHGKL